MEIKIYQQLNDIEKITGTAVIIDVFRAFTVESYLLAGGIRNLYAVGDASLAYAYREGHPDALLIGERHGKIMDGFDYGNSPSQIAAASFAGRDAVHTTSAGTQGIAGAINATEILAAGLVNAAATARYILRSGASDVALVCMGLEAVKPTQEDTLCARYIKALLKNPAKAAPGADASDLIDWPAEIDILKQTSGAKFFDRTLSDIFPEEDFHRSVEVDRFDFAIKAADFNAGLYRMKML